MHKSNFNAHYPPDILVQPARLLTIHSMQLSIQFQLKFLASSIWPNVNVHLPAVYLFSFIISSKLLGQKQSGLQSM